MATPPKTAPTQVMIVEGEVATRSLIAEKLRSLGLRVVEAADAKEVSVYLRGGEPVDMIFRDIQLAPGSLEEAELGYASSARGKAR